jgi:hypothetical protein
MGDPIYDWSSQFEANLAFDFWASAKSDIFNCSSSEAFLETSGNVLFRPISGFGQLGCPLLEFGKLPLKAWN